jgi:hypothetical protein
MPSKNRDLHGNTPDKCRAALLLVDGANDYAMRQIQGILKANTTASDRIEFAQLV